jgi:hypothetical protein
MREQIIAVFHDAEGFVFVGYGNDPDAAYTDMVQAHDDESIDLTRVAFYKYMPIKAKITFQ